MGWWSRTHLIWNLVRAGGGGIRIDKSLGHSLIRNTIARVEKPKVGTTKNTDRAQDSSDCRLSVRHY